MFIAGTFYRIEPRGTAALCSAARHPRITTRRAGPPVAPIVACVPPQFAPPRGRIVHRARARQKSSKQFLDFNLTTWPYVLRLLFFVRGIAPAAA
jgi:hypothetical protein